MLIFNIIHWSTLILMVIISFLIFKDLADVSQWIIQTPRSKVMQTFKYRHVLAGIYICTVLITIITFIAYGVGILWLLILSITLSLFLFYMGYFNPSFMMRAQYKSPNYYTIEQTKKYISDNTSLIVMETQNGIFGHTDEGLLRPHVVSPTEENMDNIVMTYCGLTNMGIAYKPIINKKLVKLVPFTQLENNLVMWDKNSGSPVQQLIGTFHEDEKEKEKKMPEWPTYRMPFWAFERTFPNGKVFLNPIKSFWQNPLLYIYDNIMHLLFTDGVQKQAKYEKPLFPTIEKFDTRLPNKTKIYGVNIKDDYVAYTKEFIVKNNLLNVTIGDQNVVVAYHRNYDSIGMYINPTNQPIKYIEFGGNSNMGNLARVSTMKSEAYWMVWQIFFPQTAINRPE